MVCRTVVALSCLGLAAAQQLPQGSCDESSLDVMTCCDTTPANNDKCVKHVKWAMEQGAPKHPHWYNIYDVKQGDTYANFQCALFMISEHKKEQAEEAGFPAEQHGCPRPCTATVENGCRRPVVPTVAAPRFKQAEASCPHKYTPHGPGCDCGFVEGTVPCIPAEVGGECGTLVCPQETCKPLVDGKSDCSSVEPWKIALIVILVLALLAALAYVLCMPTEKAKKKKRAIKKAPPPAPVEPAPLPVQPVSYTMQPVQSFTMVQQPPPVQMVTMVQQPMTYAAPPPQPVQVVQQQPMIQTYAAPVATQQTMVQTYAAPVVTAQPVQYVQQPVNMFDALDRNGDGVITRAEMAAMGQFQQPQVMQYR